MSTKAYPGRDAVKSKGWLVAHKWLLIRRAVQFGILGLFLAGPLAGVWIVKGNLTSSLTLGVLPLSDPFILVQSLLAGHVAAASALIGAAVVLAVYVLVGGRSYCSFVCPMNIVTDASRWAAKRLDLPKGWQPVRETRLWILASVMVTALITGVMAWEMLNPVTILHRGLVFGSSYVWTVALAIFLFDLVVSRRGWCGHLCPMGAFYGLIGSVSLTRVSAQNRKACNDCMDCFAVCPEPHVITPALRGAGSAIGPVILSGDCTNCGRCIDVCAKDVFSFDVRFRNDPPKGEVDEESIPISTDRHAA
ncbi:quinol dehydrogenase ferredoxin subunit NapH [Magnetovibrio sp.]|uniref:quinol dehydrogenase ferredoxin subunit NapH n=1 Tax=Magnetovibrio sp. TaxID=2024836 RepID=UPI002F939A31